ncbi:heat shock protein 30C-like [Branchiostoma floridae x Branchiostoma japonicum]
MALVFSPFYPSRHCCRVVRPRGYPGLAHDVPLSVMEHQMDAALQDGLLFLNQLLSPSQCPCRPPTQQNKDPEKTADEGKKEKKNEATPPEKYEVSLDLTGFSPDEISVKTVGNKVRVQGKHEARHADQTGHSFRYQELWREFVLPEGVDPATVTSVLSKDGVLSIQAPRMAIEAAPAEKVVPVESAEVPAVENGTEDTGSAEGDDEMGQ